MRARRWRPVSPSWPDGQTIQLGYEPTGGRLSTLTLPGSQVTTYAYGATTGTLSSITAPGSTISYTYDGSLLKQTTWAGTVAGSISRNYDNNFRITSQSINGANTINFGYDNDSLLTSAGSLTISRSAQNGLITGTTLSSVADTRSYSTFGELSSYTANVSGSPVLSTTFTRDKLGRITQKVETIGGTTTTYDYLYDPAGRLQEVKTNGTVTATYTYDTNENRTSLVTSSGTTSGTYDTQDRLTAYGTATYTYSNNGELQTKVTGAQTTSYVYDVLDNLKLVSLPTGISVAYVVDGQNRRIGKKVNGVVVQGFLYHDQVKPVAELDGTGSIISRFVYATKPSVPDYMIKAGVTYQIVSDQIGSPRLVINTSNGAIVQRIDYDEFGNVLLDTNPGFQPFGFAGGLYDRDTGLTRFGVRDYDAQIGRWTTKDPVTFNGSANSYVYAHSDPVNILDLTGYRPLTANEGNFLKQYFGNSLDTSQIDLVGGSCLGAPCSPYGNTIWLPEKYFKNNNPACEVDLSKAGYASIFAHEAAHVWQRQHGDFVSASALPLQFLSLFGYDPYDYDRSQTNPDMVLKNFKEGTVEQQGQMVQDLVSNDRSGLDTSKFGGVRNYLFTR